MTDSNPFAADPPALSRPLSGILNRPLRTIDANATVEDAVAVMLGLRVRALPVLDGWRLVGVLTRVAEWPRTEPGPAAKKSRMQGPALVQP